MIKLQRTIPLAKRKTENESKLASAGPAHDNGNQRRRNKRRASRNEKEAKLGVGKRKGQLQNFRKRDRARRGNERDENLELKKCNKKINFFLNNENDTKRRGGNGEREKNGRQTGNREIIGRPHLTATLNKNNKRTRRSGWLRNRPIKTLQTATRPLGLRLRSRRLCSTPFWGGFALENMATSKWKTGTRRDVVKLEPTSGTIQRLEHKQKKINHFHGDYSI